MSPVFGSRVAGPWCWSPFGSLSDLRGDPLSLLTEARAVYGDVVRFRVGIWYAYLLVHPDDVRRVLQDNSQNYRKGFTFEYLKPVLGLGLLTNEGESWLRQRRLAQPAFHRDRLNGFAEILTDAIERMVQRWRNAADRREVDIVPEMTGLTMEMVGRALLASNFGADSGAIAEAVRVGQGYVNWQITHLFTVPERFPTPKNRQFKKAQAVLNDVVFSIIEQRRSLSERQRTSGSDLLSLLLAARDEETGEGMTDGQIRDEVMTILLAGHETTANALAWSWHLLSLNPEAEERLHCEVDAVLNGRRPGLTDLPRLEFTRRVFDEALRLRPPVWAIGRFSVRDDVAGRFRLPAHSSIILSPFVTHRHPEFWPEPLRFDPDRFLPERVSERPRFAYFPFGGGPRMCIGSEFAAMEGVLALAAIASEFRLVAIPGRPVEPEPLVTLRPKGGLPMTIERRHGASRRQL